MVLQLHLVRMSWRMGPPLALTMVLTKPRGYHSLVLVFMDFKVGGNVCLFDLIGYSPSTFPVLVNAGRLLSC